MTHVWGFCYNPVKICVAGKRRPTFRVPKVFLAGRSDNLYRILEIAAEGQTIGAATAVGGIEATASGSGSVGSLKQRVKEVFGGKLDFPMFPEALRNAEVERLGRLRVNVLQYYRCCVKAFAHDIIGERDRSPAIVIRDVGVNECRVPDRKGDECRRPLDQRCACCSIPVALDRFRTGYRQS